MQRNTVCGIVQTLLLLDLLVLASNIQLVRSDTEIIFSDDFETYVVGSFPHPPWELWYSGAGGAYQTIVDQVSFSPTKSFQLLGWGVEGGSHMAAVTAFPFVWNEGSLLAYSAYVMVDEICAFDFSAVLGFGRRTPVGIIRSNEVRFRSDGMVTTRYDIPLQSYEPDTWYKIEAHLDTTTDTYSIWIDDELKGSGFDAMIPSNEITVFLLTSNYGNVKAYFDNVIVSSEIIGSQIAATIDIDPDTLNLRSQGEWITAFIELPEGYSVNNIDISTVKLNLQVPAKLHPTKIGDYDEDGIPDLMVKFSRKEVTALLVAGENTLTITGEVSGEMFEGSDTITAV